MAASGMIRYCMCLVVCCIRDQKILDCLIWSSPFFLFIYLLCHSCLLCFDQHVDCVILDDGGFLLMSNQDEYITQVRVPVLTSVYQENTGAFYWLSIQ